MAYNTQQAYNGYNAQQQSMMQQGMMQQVTMLPQGQQFYSMDPQVGDKTPACPSLPSL